MEHLVVLQAEEQGVGDVPAQVAQEDRSAGNADGRVLPQGLEEAYWRKRPLPHPLVQDLTAAAPRRHQREHDRRDHEREPFCDLEHVRAEEGEVDDEEDRGSGST